MKPTYEEITTPSGNKVINAYYENGVVHCIPCNPDNADYQAYLNKDKPQVEHLTEIPTN